MYNIQLKQGCVLADGDAHKLGLVDVLNTNKRVVVISHDCDLLSQKEESIEVIMGTVIAQPNPSFENVRHPRYLHLCYLDQDNIHMHIELQHSNKQQIDKKEFSRLLDNFPHILVPRDSEKRTLKQWLAARYGRPAFPNAFEERLRKRIGKIDVIKRIEQILENYSQHLVGLFFDLGEDRFNEVSDDEPYYLSILVVYDFVEGQKEREIAEKVADKLKGLFEEAYGLSEIATEIVLEQCTAVADSIITLADLRKIDQWRLEHISLGENPIEAFVSASDVPN